MTSKFSLRRAGTIVSLMFLMAVRTPLPWYSPLMLSLNSRASWTPVEAPEGTAARKRPNSVTYTNNTQNIKVVFIALLDIKLKRKVLTNAGCFKLWIYLIIFWDITHSVCVCTYFDKNSETLYIDSFNACLRFIFFFP